MLLRCWRWACTTAGMRTEGSGALQYQPRCTQFRSCMPLGLTAYCNAASSDGCRLTVQVLLLAMAFLLELVLKHVHRRHRADGHLQVYRYLPAASSIYTSQHELSRFDDPFAISHLVCLRRRTKGLVRYPFRIASVATATFMLASAWPEGHRWLVRVQPPVWQTDSN
jgi:hypothetical protein